MAATKTPKSSHRNKSGSKHGPQFPRAPGRKVGETSAPLGEFELIARYFAPLAKGFPGAYGLLDDAAVIATLQGHELVVKTDAIVGDVHFLLDDPPELIARKALRVNLSDLAAKGAVPRAYMLDIMLPKTVTEEWIATFARGLAQDQDAYRVHLIGGDTDSTPGPVTIAIVAFGDSLTAGFGTEPGNSYPDFLQKDLDRDGLHWRVVNAGVSGDTCANRLSPSHQVPSRRMVPLPSRSPTMAPVRQEPSIAA